MRLTNAIFSFSFFNKNESEYSCKPFLLMIDDVISLCLNVQYLLLNTDDQPVVHDNMDGQKSEESVSTLPKPVVANIAASSDVTSPRQRIIRNVLLICVDPGFDQSNKAYQTTFVTTPRCR